MSITLHYPELDSSEIPDPKTENVSETVDLSLIGGGEVTSRREVVVGCTAEEAGEEPYKSDEYGQRWLQGDRWERVRRAVPAATTTSVGGVAVRTARIRPPTRSTTSSPRRRAARGGIRGTSR